MRLRQLVPLVIAALLAPRLAAAQPSIMMSPAPVAMERHGLFAGGGLWGGNISCEGTDCGDLRKAGGVDGHIGYLLTPNFGLVLDIWAMTSSQNNVAITYVVGTANARLYLMPRLWIQGGVGSGHAEVRVSIFGARGDDVPVGEVAAGVELVRAPNWALELAGKVAQGTATNANGDVTTGRAAGVGLTMTWFGRRPVAGATFISSR